MNAQGAGKPPGISSVGLTQEEEQIVFSTLFALAKQGQVQWRYTDAHHAVALIVDEATAPGRKAAAEFMEVAGRALILVDGANLNPLHRRFVMQRPLTETSVKEMITRLTECFANPAYALAAVATGASASHTSSPESRLIDVLRNLMLEDGGIPAFSIMSAGFPPIVVSPKAHKVLFETSWEEFRTGDLMAPVTVEEVLVGDPKLSRLVVAGEPLSHLLWMVGFLSGKGHLFPFLDGRRPYKLSRWPSMYTVNLDGGFVRVMSYLSKSAAPLEDIARQTGVTCEEVADLLNACSLCGCLDLAAPAARPSDSPERFEAAKERRSLFNRIRQKLGLAQIGVQEA